MIGQVARLRGGHDIPGIAFLLRPTIGIVAITDPVMTAVALIGGPSYRVSGWPQS